MMDIDRMYPSSSWFSPHEQKEERRQNRKIPKRRFSTPQVSCLIRTREVEQENYDIGKWHKHTDDIPHLFKVGKLKTSDDMVKIPQGLDGRLSALSWDPKFRRFPMIWYQKYHPRGFYLYQQSDTKAWHRRQEFLSLMYQRRYSEKQETKRRNERRLEKETKERQARLQESIENQKTVLRVKYIELVRAAKIEAKKSHLSALRKGQSLEQAKWILDDLAKSIENLKDAARIELESEIKRVTDDFWT